MSYFRCGGKIYHPHRKNRKKRKETQKIAIVAVILIYIWTNKKNSFIVVDEP